MCYSYNSFGSIITGCLKEKSMATGILVFDFGLLIDGRLIYHERLPVFQDTCIGNVAVL